MDSCSIGRTVFRGGMTTAVVALLVSGCASGGAGGSGGAEGGGADLITLAEIEAAPSGTAYDIVSLLRPRWLRPRTRAPSPGGGGFGAPTPDPFVGSADPAGSGVLPVVFMDNTRFGEAASLRSISSSIVERMEYMDARDATTLYGTGYDGGVIQVFTRR